VYKYKKDQSLLNEKKIVILLFFVSICLCFTISSFSKSLFLSADEMRYIAIARSIANGRDMTYIHHIVTDYQKVLYPFFISLAYRVHDFHLQVIIVGLINAILMSSSVFPAYLLAKKYLNSSRQVLLICVFTILYPELVMTMTFMSENLYFPMALWEIYIVHKVFENKDRNGLLCLFGVWTYLLYLCKEVGICFLLGYILTECFVALYKRRVDKNMIKSVSLPVVFFLMLFFLAKCTIFSDMGNSYDQTSIDAILSGKAVLYFFYACIYYLVYVIISFYFFPIIFCTFKWNELSEKAKYMFAFLSNMVIVIIGTVGYTISIREDLGSFSPHLHMRYFAPLAIPFFIIFFHNFKMDEKLILKKWQRYVMVVFIIGLIIIPNICQRGLMDSQNMEFYRCICIALAKLFGKTGDILAYFVVKPIWLFMLIGGYYELKKKPKQFLKYFIITAFTLNITNYILKYMEVRIFYSASKEAVNEMQELNEKLDGLSGNKLLVGKYLTDQAMELADTYLDDENMYYTSASVVEDWENLYPEKVPCTWPIVDYSDMGEIEYFIIDNEINQDGLGVKEIVWKGNIFSIWH